MRLCLHVFGKGVPFEEEEEKWMAAMKVSKVAIVKCVYKIVNNSSQYKMGSV